MNTAKWHEFYFIFEHIMIDLCLHMFETTKKKIHQLIRFRAINQYFFANELIRQKLLSLAVHYIATKKPMIFTICPIRDNIYLDIEHKFSICENRLARFEANMRKMFYTVSGSKNTAIECDQLYDNLPNLAQ